MKIKKIFKSLDFRNNKIINAKTVTPTDDKHIVPKDYADNLTTFNTSNANNGILSYFPWMQNLFNKPIKEILDNLLYPVIKPTYKNPEYYNVIITDFDEYNVVGERKSIFLNRLTKFRIDYQITESDRISGFTPKVIVTSKTGTVTEYNGTITSDTLGFVEFQFMFSNIQSIILRKVFQDVDVIKNDNFGNPYIPNEFTLNYNLDYDIMNLIIENYELFEPVITYKLPNNNPSNILTILDNITDNENLVTSNDLNIFVKDTKFFVNGNNNIYIIGIPEPLYENSTIKLHIDDRVIDMNVSMLGDCLNYVIDNENYDNIKTLTYYGKSINYYFGVIDLGSFTESKLVNFQFDLFNSSSKYGKTKNSLSWLINELQNIKELLNSQNVGGNSGNSVTNIIKINELHVFKVVGNTSEDTLEINDYVKGIVDNMYIEGFYLGGDISILASYDITSMDGDQIEFFSVAKFNNIAINEADTMSTTFKVNPTGPNSYWLKVIINGVSYSSHVSTGAFLQSPLDDRLSTGVISLDIPFFLQLPPNTEVCFYSNVTPNPISDYYENGQIFEFNYMFVPNNIMNVYEGVDIDEIGSGAVSYELISENYLRVIFTAKYGGILKKIEVAQATLYNGMSFINDTLAQLSEENN